MCVCTFLVICSVAKDYYYILFIICRNLSLSIKICPGTSNIQICHFHVQIFTNNIIQPPMISCICAGVPSPAANFSYLFCSFKFNRARIDEKPICISLEKYTIKNYIIPSWRDDDFRAPFTKQLFYHADECCWKLLLLKQSALVPFVIL